MCAREASSCARCRWILYSALSGSACTALVKYVTAASQSDDPRRLLALAEGGSGRAAGGQNGDQDNTCKSASHVSCQLQLPVARPSFQIGFRAPCSLPVAKHARTGNWTLDLSLAPKWNRSPARAVGIFHDDRLHADLHDPIAAVNYLPFAPVEHIPAVRERRDLARPAASNDAEELQRNRRRPGRLRRLDWPAEAARAPASSSERRLRRRRLGLKSKRIPPPSLSAPAAAAPARPGAHRGRSDRPLPAWLGRAALVRLDGPELGVAEGHS